MSRNFHGSFGGRIEELLEKRPVAPLFALYFICVAIFLAAVPLPRVDGHLVGSDGTYYYAYLPTLLLDHDLDLSNQYSKLIPAHLQTPQPADQTHGFPNQYAIGAAVLWTPFFLIGHLVSIGLNSVGLAVPLDGIAYAYQIPVLLGSITYAFAGVLLVYRSCRRFFTASCSAAAVILIWLSTNLIYYMIAEPSMSHACSFFAAALFLYLWLRFRPLPATGQWMLLGIAAGLVALVRLQDSTCLVLPVLDTLLIGWAERKDSIKRRLAGLFCFGAVALIVFLPQMAVWRILNGSPTGVGYPHSDQYFHWFAPQFLSVLFSLHHGLYVWHPVLFFATLGLILFYRRNRTLALLLGLMFAAQVYVIGAWTAWWGGDAFGARMLISTFPVLALGLAALVERAMQYKALKWVALSGCVLIVWNALFFAQYRFRYISHERPITLRQMTVGKLEMLKHMAGQVRRMIR